MTQVSPQTTQGVGFCSARLVSRCRSSSNNLCWSHFSHTFHLPSLPVFFFRFNLVTRRTDSLQLVSQYETGINVVVPVGKPIRRSNTWHDMIHIDFFDDVSRFEFTNKPSRFVRVSAPALHFVSRRPEHPRLSETGHNYFLESCIPFFGRQRCERRFFLHGYFADPQFAPTCTSASSLILGNQEGDTDITLLRFCEVMKPSPRRQSAWISS